MLRRLWVTFVVVASLVLIAGGLSLLFMPKNNQAEFGMIDSVTNGAIGERENSLDVLFVGDSEVRYTYSPLQMWNEYGFTSYDVSCSGQRIPYSFTLLKRALSKQAPRVVVFETNALYRLFSLDEGIFRAIEDAVPLLEYHNRWKSLTQADITSTPQATWSDDFKGYTVANGTKAADISKYAKQTDEVTSVPRNNRLWMRMMVEYCLERSVTPILMSSPSPINWDMSKHNGLQELANELGVVFVDLNLVHMEMGMDWNADTHDAGDHLNASGAKKVSSYVGEYLSKTYGLKDHRGDTAYASWNASYERYAKRLREES